MNWLLPQPQIVLPALRRIAGQVKDRHRPGYWRDYHARRRATRRPYLTAKAREYRARGA